MSFFSSLLLLVIFPKVVYPLDECEIAHCAKCVEGTCQKCDFGYFLDTKYNECPPCSINCKECQSPRSSTQCTSCYDGYYLNKEYSPNYGKCEKCTSDLCNQCTKEYRQEYKCTGCIPGYFLDSNTCQKCDESCNTCLSTAADKCLTCKDGFYSLSNDQNGHTCQRCANLCKKCHGQNIEDCEECSTGFYYKDDICQKCDDNCESCSGTSDHCTSCHPGNYLSENTCNQCTDNCQKCDGPGESECTICNDGYYNYYGECKDCAEYNCFKCLRKEWGEVFCTGKCFPGYYVNIYDNDDDDSTFKCVYCGSEGCNTCDKDHYHCDSCRPGFVMVNDKCEPCESPCLTCENEPKNCLSCVKEFYFNNNTKTCDKCPNNCDHCDSRTNCLECKESFYESNGACINCHESCQTCHDGTNSCDKCKIGYFFNSKNQCEKCSDHCQECDIDSCYRCDDDFYPERTYCLPCAPVCKQCNGPTANDCVSCDPGFYFSHQNKICAKCNEACETCRGPTDDRCMTCAKGYFMDDKSHMPGIEWPVRRCTSCEYNCAECENLINCKQCKDGFRLYKRDNEEDYDCQPCQNKGCKKCDSAANQCTECFEGFYQSEPDKNNFVTCSYCPTGCKKCEKSKCTECIDGYYLDNGACKLCKSPCATCSSASRCLSCIDGHLLSRLGNCNAKCSSNCLACENNMNHCTSCKNGFVLSGTKCVSCLDGCRTCEFYENTICTSCMNGFYLDGEKCNKCDSSCKSCYGTSTSCSTCADGYYFTSMNYEPGSYYTGLCSLCNGTGHENCQLCIENCNDDDKFTCSPNPICTKCSDGFYIDNNFECQKCNESCKTCTGPTDADCILCIDGYKWIGAVCINVSDSCIANKHCDFDNSEGNEILNYTSDLPSYNEFHNDKGGGAIRLINYGFQGENAVFTGCYSENGGGGGIYIYNTLKDAKYEISLKKLTFKSCRAKFGGSVYIYSPSEKSYVKIDECSFISNVISDSQSNSRLSGGSAIYLTVAKGNINDCIFSNNKGNGGIIKVTDDFSVLPESVKMLQNVNDSKVSFLISDCIFEVERNSGSSLFYTNDNGLTKINVNHCIFTGNLANDAHFIDGNSFNNNNPNIIIKSCKFSVDENKAINGKFIINKVDLLAENSFAKKKLSTKIILLNLSAIIGVVAIVIAIVIMKRNKHNDNSQNLESSQV